MQYNYRCSGLDYLGAAVVPFQRDSDREHSHYRKSPEGNPPVRYFANIKEGGRK